jgi:hypothetical protein
MLRRLGAAFVIALGGLLLIATIGYWRFTAAIDRPAAAVLPQTLAGLPLTTATYGPQAVTEIARLHGKRFPLTAGAMGVYGSQKQAILWVAEVPVNLMAARMVEAMQEKIAEGTSPFTPDGERQDGKRIIYELTGMGQKHFYFQSAAQVVWLAADPEIAEQALREALTFYP